MGTRQDLADFALRQLGGGVVNVEISDDQIEDNIKLAVQYYQEFHFDGTERDYVSKLINPTRITVADVTGFNVGDKVTSSAGAISYVYDINATSNIISTIKNRGIPWAVTNTITNGTVTQTISGVVLGEIDLQYFTLDDSIFNVINIINTSSLMNNQFGDFMFNPQYQLMAPEVLNMVKGGAGMGGIGYFYGTMNYISQLDFVLRKVKSFRFNRRMNKCFLDIDWASEVHVGDYIAMEVYRALDPESYNEVYDDMWLKAYTTSLFKRQWGTNLKKYSGMQMPGGITYDGQGIFDESIREIRELEQKLIDQEPPLLMMVG
jgi:hypothetical protein